VGDGVVVVEVIELICVGDAEIVGVGEFVDAAIVGDIVMKVVGLALTVGVKDDGVGELEDVGWVGVTVLIMHGGI